MPEYLAPAVYVEETSFRPKPLEGASTSTTAFVGRTRRGPVSSQTTLLTPAELDLSTPELITSVGDFERLYGSTNAIGSTPNYLAHAVRGFFANGGRRLYVARVMELTSNTAEARAVQVSATDGTPAWLTGGDGPKPATATAVGTTFNLGQAVALVIDVNGSATTVTLSPGDFADFTAATVAEVAAAINAAGVATIETVASTAPLTIVAKAVGASLSLTGTAVAKLGLPAGGTGDPATATGGSGPFGLSANLTLNVSVAGESKAVALPEASFADFSAATVAEVAALINAESFTELETVASTAPLRLVSKDSGHAVTITLSGSARVKLNLPASSHGEDGPPSARFEARFPGSAGNGRVVATKVRAPASERSLQRAAAGTMIAATTAGPTVTLYVKQDSSETSAWVNAANGTVTLATIVASTSVEFVSFNLEVSDADGYRQLFGNLSLSPQHPTYIGHVLGMVPPRRAEQLENLVALVIAGVPSPFDLHTGLTTGASNDRAVFLLGNGSDGAEPGSQRYHEGLESLDAIDGISIIAAPGSSASSVAEAIRSELIENAERRGAYRIAVLDAPAGQTVGQIRNIRATMDSDHAALYHPWILVANPDARPGDSSRPLELAVPPSGHVCGIYARNDSERGVHKAPANEVVIGALRFESNITMGQQEVLNPEGINVLRSFRGRGHRIWGARLASSDPEFKYVNVRRYFNYISATLDRGTQWVVFEPNSERLWERVTATVSDFLYDEWTNGALLGRTQDEAFFVRCGRMTMTQSDIDNGRLICEVGMAIVYPAEFVIFRIGQKTATANS